MNGVYRGWRVVFASVVGLAVSPGPVAFYSIGILMGPLMTERGWTTSQLSLLATLLTVSIFVTMPLIGAAIDRFGAKQVLLPSMIAFAATLASAAFVSSLTALYVTYAAIGIACTAANSVPYMRAITAWFDRRRGLAVGIASAGMGAGFAIVPAYTHFFLERGGIQGAYLGLGALILFIGVPVVMLAFENAPRNDDEQMLQEFERSRRAGVASDTGAAAVQAVRMPQFWLLMIGYACASGSIYGSAVHLVPAVEKIAASSQQAVLAATLFGVTAMAGRVVAGYLCDRLFAPYVACGVFLSGALGLVLLASGVGGAAVLLAALLLGLCSGAEGDTLAVLCGRYFGQRAYGKIYGHAISATLAGISIIPLGIGMAYDHFNSYRWPLLAVAATLAMSGTLLLRLGPYPRYDGDGHLIRTDIS